MATGHVLKGKRARKEETAHGVFIAWSRTMSLPLPFLILRIDTLLAKGKFRLPVTQQICISNGRGD